MYFKRGKRALLADTSSRDMYNFYKERCKPNPLEYSKFISIWKRFIELRLQMVVFENSEFHMPYRLGSIRIKIGGDSVRLKKDGTLKLIPDWGASKKLWKEQYPGLTPEEIKAIPNKEKVYFLNEHTDGKVLHWHWDKQTSNFKNKGVYRIHMNRKWKKMLTSKIKTTKKIEYYE